jgi:hypothetical protein
VPERNSGNERNEVHRKNMPSDKKRGQIKDLHRFSLEISAFALKAGPYPQGLQPDESFIKVKKNRP